MPIATRTIQNSIEFCKRMSFNRNPVLGNSMEPALTAAALVMQTVLSPPFEWWWNNEELVFTCNPTANSATASNSVSTGGTLTVTATNTFSATNLVTAAGYTGALEALNGQIFELATASSGGFTIDLPAGAPTGTDTSGAVFTNVSTQDYTIPVPNFSHIEHASVMDLNQVAGSNPATYTQGEWKELTIKNNLTLESEQSRPIFISPHVEDGNGNMTFRVFPAPDKPYPISIHVQLTAPSLATLGVNSPWAPIPDFMQYVYDYGFLALMWMFADDPRSTWAENKFKAAILGRAEGLTEEQKNIFLNNWDDITQNQMMKMQQGNAARLA
jgi:hypothetical protein